MWLATLLPLVALTAVDPSSATAPPTTSPAAIYTRQALFAIPFQIERPASIHQEPVEVQLHVSGDRGAHWDLYARSQPTKQQFLFRAGGDGEYWFQVRTLDRSGQLRPEVVAPGLKVIVKTLPPKLQLDARRGDAGQVVIRWQSDDSAAKPDTLKIQFRVAPNAPWQPVAIGPPQAGPHTTGALTGETTLWPPAGTALMEIRGEVADLAGNPAVSTAQVALAKSATPGTGVVPTSGSYPSGASGGVATSATEAWRASHPDAPATPWPADNAPASGQRPPVGAQTAATAPVAPTAPANPIARPSTVVTTPAQPPASDAAAPSSASGNRTQILFAGEQREGAQEGSVALRVNPPIRNQYVTPSEKPNTPRQDWASYGVPEGERVRMVNARVFELEYDAESVGPSGIGRVELWGTRDGGRTWQSFGTDEDKRSPFVVNVEEEGVYGFRLALQSGAGLGGRPPQRGDLPEVWIGIDLSKPNGRVTSAEQGTGTDANKLVISWDATDNLKLAARPITLAFSETLGGPWTTIAAGIENSGRYTWTIDPRSPQRVFLRIEIRDEAGNIGISESQQSLSLDHAIPTARIRDVRPLSQSNRVLGDRSYLR